MASTADLSEPILADIQKASLACKDLLMEICQWTKETNREKNVSDSLDRLINELESLEQYSEVKEENTLAAITVNLQNLLPILLSSTISKDQLEKKIKEANTLGIELITTLNKIKDKWLKNKGKISYINTSIQNMDDGDNNNIPTPKSRSSKRKSTFSGFTRSIHNSFNYLSHGGSSHASAPSEEMDITGPIQSPIFKQEKSPSTNNISLNSPPKTDPDMLEMILRALPPKPTSSPFEVNAVPPLEIGKSITNNSSNYTSSPTAFNDNIELPTINSGNEESLEQNLLNVFDFIYGEDDKKAPERKSNTNLFNEENKVDNYEFKTNENDKNNDYQYITQEIPETPLSETVFNQLNHNNDLISKSRDLKGVPVIKEENDASESLNKENENKKGYNIFLQYRGQTKRIFVLFENISYDSLKNIFIEQFDCNKDFDGNEFPKIYINNQKTIDLFYELNPSCTDIKENSILKLNEEEQEESKDELISEIKELKSIIHKSNISLNAEPILSDENKEKVEESLNNNEENGQAEPESKNEKSESEEKVANTSITVDTKIKGRETSPSLYKELYDIRSSILDIVNNFVNSPVVKESQEKVLALNTNENNTQAEIQGLKETINDWINYQKHISSITSVQTPIVPPETSTLSDPYKDIESMINTYISGIQNYMNNELKTLNENVNSKLDGIVTTIMENSPTSSSFKTPDSEGFMSNFSNFNNDIKSNMNDSINELKKYIRDIIETKISENTMNSNNNNNDSNIRNQSYEEESQKQINSTLNELKSNIEAMNSNHSNMFNELMTRIANENDNRIREMEERFNQKLEALTNSQNRVIESNNNEEQAQQTKLLLENMERSIKELKSTINAKNNEIEKLKEMTEQMNKNTSALASNDRKEDEEKLKYMEFTKTLEEDIKQQLRRFKNEICSSISRNGNIERELSSSDEALTPTPDNMNKKDFAFKDDQDTIDYVKQIRDNVDRQLIEFKMAINDLSKNVSRSNVTSSSNSNGFNPEMIETIRSFRSEIKSQYQDFCDMMKDIIMKQNENNNKREKDLPSSVNKIIKDDTKETYNLINNEFFKLRQFMVEVIKISQTRKATKTVEIGQLPVNVETNLNQTSQANQTRKISIAPTGYNKLVNNRNELSVIKKNIKNIKQQFESFRLDSIRNINRLKNLVSLLNKTNPGSPSEQRQKLLNEKNALAGQSEMIKNKLKELRLLLESIGVDVSRKCNPKLSVMNYVKNEIKMINSETQRFSDTIKSVNVNWKSTWEKELQEIVSEQKALKANIESSAEFEDDCKTLSDGFGVILKVLSMQKEIKQCNMTNVLDPEELKESGAHSGLMDEIKAMSDDESSTKRLEAIEKALKIQEIVRENSKKNEFELELDSFIENNKYKINQKVMEFDKQQKEKKEEQLKELWKNEQNNKKDSDTNVPAM